MMVWMESNSAWPRPAWRSCNVAMFGSNLELTWIELHPEKPDPDPDFEVDSSSRIVEQQQIPIVELRRDQVGRDTKSFLNILCNWLATRWARSTFSSRCPLSSNQSHWLTSATSIIFSEEKFREHWESNPGLLDEKHLCAMHLPPFFFNFVRVRGSNPESYWGSLILTCHELTQHSLEFHSLHFH